jgi:hypothetical protein
MSNPVDDRSGIVPPFEASRLKIAQARRHIATLRAILLDYSDRVHLELKEVARSEDEQGIKVHLAPRFSEPPPEDIPLWIGDAIHNLRSALDIMICDIGRAKERPTNNLKLPFAKNLEELNKILTNKDNEFRRLGDVTLEAIRTIRPYTENGHPLVRGLHA